MTDYIIRHIDTNVAPITVQEDTVDRTSVDVPLIGRILTNYGTDVNENLLNLLENFACPEDSASLGVNDAFPDLSKTSKEQLHQPVEGQFWYNINRELIYFFDGTAWNPIPVRGNYAANWGQVTHGQALPRPQNFVGYTFPYTECIWAVAPASLNGSVDYFTCGTDANAVVNFQYRHTNSSTMINGIANYLIVGISGNSNNGTVIPPLVPTPTPTVTVSSTPAPSLTPTPSETALPTPTATPQPTPTPTAAVTGTPAVTPTSTPAASAPPSATPAVTPTPTASPVPSDPPGLPSSLGGGCYVRTGVSGSSVSYFVEFGATGQITEASSLAPAIPGNRGNWLGSLPGDSAANYEIRFGGSAPDGKISGNWYPLASGQTFTWSFTLGTTPSGGRFVSGLYTLRRITTGEIIDTCPVESTQLGINRECV